VSEIHVTYLSDPDVAQLALTEDEIPDAVEAAPLALLDASGITDKRTGVMTALGAAMLDKAERLGLGQRLRFA
jgi:hypothetical protein